MARLPLAAGSTLALALALAACGSVAGQHAGTGSAATPATPAQASPRGTLAQTTCGPPPPRHAWAVEVTRTGHTAWETPLETRGTMPSPVVQPVVAGPVAVLAQDGIVHGIRLADGHPLWSWPGGQSVYGLWRWGGLVAVLTDRVSNHARLTGLDAATGAVRWSLRLPASVILTEGQNHVAVVARDVVNGRVRWRDPVSGPSEDYQPVLAVGPLAILQGEPGAQGGTAPLLAYQAASGRLAWRAAMPAFVQVPTVLVPDGILVQPADLGYACAAAQ